MLTFGVFDRTTGLPLSGIAGSLSWQAYYVASTGVDPGSHPTFHEFGTKGFYYVDVPPEIACIIDCTSDAVERYRFFPPLVGNIFPIFDDTGAPVTGFNPTVDNWQALYNATTAVAYDPSLLSFTELGGGLYRVDGMPSYVAGRLDFGSGYIPQYYELSVGPDSAGPVIGNISPAPGTPLVPTSTIQLDVTDPASPIVACVLIADFPNIGTSECIYDGTSFKPLYAGLSSVTPITNGQRFQLVRTGGWPSNVLSLLPIVVDSAGKEDS